MNTIGKRPHCDHCEYIFDIYFPYDQADSLHLWTKTTAGQTRHYELLYHPRIYVTADLTYPSLHHEAAKTNIDNETRALHFFYKNRFERSMEQIYLDLKTLPSVVSVSRVKRFYDNFYDEPGDVWEVRLFSYAKQHFDEIIHLLGMYKYKVFNCDINKRQHFFLDVGVTPMTAVHIETGDRGWICSDHNFSSSGNGVELVGIQQMESIRDLEYFIPEFTLLDLSIEVSIRNIFPDKYDPIKSVHCKVTKLYGQDRQIEKGKGARSNNSPFEQLAELTLSGYETDILVQLNRLITKFDPDIINIDQGDRFYLNYLAQRAKFNGVKLIMDRLGRPLYPRKEQSGQTYMTYGQIMRRDPVRYLPGRIFLDKHNSFNLEESGIPGMIEMSRISGLPPVRTSRSSIGSTLTGVEFHINQQSNPPTLVPVAKSRGEHFKTAHQLLIADNGGLIYPGKPGVYDRVWAIDFTSLYPFIMLKHNLGSETVLCEHRDCQNQELQPIIVDELGYHICKQRYGVVAKTMDLVLSKRVRLKEIKKSELLSQVYQDITKGVDSAYKWILVSSFGYLGFKNARWGSIEAHQAVTAYGRRYLLQARRICEDFGFEVLAGITDSLFIRAKSKDLDTWEVMQELAKEISDQTEIPMDVEGKFQWLVFSSVKDSEDVAALNRYYGMFTDGEFKLRGIKHRQRRAFALEKQLTEDVLEKMALAQRVEDFKVIIPQTYTVLQDYIRRLQARLVSPFDLITKLKSTRGSGNYRATSTIQAIATQRYADLGSPVQPGESFFFLVVDDTRKNSINRVRIGDEITEDTEYDVEYYIEQINRDYLELTIEIQRQLFGRVKYDKEGIRMEMQDFWKKVADPDVAAIPFNAEIFEEIQASSNGSQISSTAVRADKPDQEGRESQGALDKFF